MMEYFDKMLFVSAWIGVVFGLLVGLIADDKSNQHGGALGAIFWMCVLIYLKL